MSSSVRTRVALSEYTTLGLGGPAGRLIEAGTGEELVAAVRAADRAGEPVLILGGGSNLVVSDDGFPGTVIRVTSEGFTVGPVRAGGVPGADRELVSVTAAAGQGWDRLVECSVQDGLAGLECLSGIPGLVGATPIQNVGAYGQEVSQTITHVRVLDRQHGEVVTLAGAQCGFGYRTSMFKRAVAGAATGRFIVLEVSFGLWRQAPSAPVSSGPALSAPVRYAELAGRLGVAVGESAPLADVRSAVLALRRGKGMVLDPADPDTRSAGSFFTNPVLNAAQFAELRQRVAARFGPTVEVPYFAVDDAPAGTAPASGGPVKVPAAWLIDRAGFGRGYPGHGAARISTKHTLALTHQGGGSTAALLALAAEITAGVSAAFQVNLAPEPVLVGVTL